MLIKKMLAVLSAVAIMGTCSVYSGKNYMLKSYAEGETASVSENCGVEVSLSPASDPIPNDAHIKARLVKVAGDETTDIEEWEITQDGVKTINDLEYSENISYKIVIDDLPEDYNLPAETVVLLHQKGDTDKIALCGVGRTRILAAAFGVDTGIKFSVRCVYLNESMTSIPGAKSNQIAEEYVIDDKGVRYCDNGLTLLPDGHYKAYVKPAEGYRFVKQNSESAAVALDLQLRAIEIERGYFDNDFENGIEFDVENGATDSILQFYIEEAPTETNCCTADISVVDEETGELLEGFTFDISNKRSIPEKLVKWKTSSDNPMKFDYLRILNYPYDVQPINAPEGYNVSETSFTFSEYGEHQDIVVKAQHIDKSGIQKVVLPDADPVPIDNNHCAVIAAAMDVNDRRPLKNATLSIYKKVNKEKTTLISWEAAEEPVKIINDIEYDENAVYYFKASGIANGYRGFSEIELKFDKGGSTDKVVQLNYPEYMRKASFELNSATISDTGTLEKSSYGWKTPDITDSLGYRYPSSPVVLPDGEYTFKPILADGYRIVPPESEMAGIFIDSNLSNKEYILHNAENYENGKKFKFEEGECDKQIRLFAEKVPTPETCCTADISVIDEATGQPVEGVKLSLISTFNDGYVNWDTTKTPVMKFDNLRFLNYAYKISLDNIPDGYSYKYDRPSFNFAGYGEHKDVVIKLTKEYVKGDLNNDGAVNLKDVTILRRYIAGGWNIELDDKLADINGDGDTNLKDVVTLRRYVAGGWNIKL